MILTTYYISIAWVTTIMESLRKLLRAVTGTESVGITLNLKKKNEYGLSLTMSTLVAVKRLACIKVRQFWITGLKKMVTARQNSSVSVVVS